MATRRAKRLEKYLHDVLGWETYTDRTVCPSCGSCGDCYTKYCQCCGSKMEKDTSRLDDVFIELEAAITHALEE